MLKDLRHGIHCEREANKTTVQINISLAKKNTNEVKWTKGNAGGLKWI